MAVDSHTHSGSRPPFAPDDALAQADRVAAEALIRSTVASLAQGAVIKDLDSLVQRNAGYISQADIRGGRLASNVLGDIVGTVEQAKGSAPFNWNAATPQQISAYLASKGLQPLGHGDAGLGRNATADKRGGSNSGASEKAADSSAGSIASVTANSFADTPFAKTGLNYAAFKSLRSEGFDGNQIVAAVNTNKQLGLGANDNPGATARLQRDVPSAIPGLFHTRDNWQQAHDLEKAEKDARARGDAATADQLKKQSEQARRNAEEHDQREQQRVRDTKPDRVEDLKSKQNEIKKSTKDQAAKLSPGDDHQIKANLDIVEKYRRNPEDAAARHNYERLKEASAKDPDKRTAVAKLEKNLAKDAKLKAGEKKLNEKKTAKNEIKIKDTDDLLASLNDEPSSVVKTPKAAEPKAMVKSDAAHNDAAPSAGKTPKRPDGMKITAAKPAAPAA